MDLSAFVLMFIVYFGCESIVGYVYWRALLHALTFIFGSTPSVNWSFES